jgi:hypothetical protein
MFWRIGLTLFFLLCASASTAHEPVLLDARRATPGLRLELAELPSTTAPDATTARYRLRVSGLPRGVVFGVWAKGFGHSFHEVASGFRMDESGVMVSSELAGAGRPRRLDTMVLDPGPYPQGAVWEVALASVDLTFTVFAKVIPRPIMARDGPCTVALELVSRRGQRFMASGAGFAPGDDVITESRYAGQIIQKRRRISAEGLLPPDVISHDSSGADRSARYAVKGRSCEVAIEYVWGEPALSRYEDFRSHLYTPVAQED